MKRYISLNSSGDRSENLLTAYVAPPPRALNCSIRLTLSLKYEKRDSVSRVDAYLRWCCCTNFSKAGQWRSYVGSAHAVDAASATATRIWRITYNAYG